MNATVAVAILSHPNRYGRTIAPQETPIKGAPLHLSLHTSAEAAVRALDAAMVEEWNEVYRGGLGEADRWERAQRSRHMVEGGYLAAVVEREVSLDDDRELPFGRLYAEPPPAVCRCGLPQGSPVHGNPFGAGHRFDPVPAVAQP